MPIEHSRSQTKTGLLMRRDHPKCLKQLVTCRVRTILYKPAKDLDLQ